jgi:hypothetical protein
MKMTSFKTTTHLTINPEIDLATSTATATVTCYTFSIQTEAHVTKQEPTAPPEIREIPDIVFKSILDRHIKEHLPLWQALADM